MQLYGLKTCDTCRKALNALPGAIFHDVRSDGVPQDLLVRAHAQFSDGLLNRRSTTWRSLSAEERAEDALVLLRRYPLLMKRPLIVDGDRLTVGWTPQVRTALGVD